MCTRNFPEMNHMSYERMSSHAYRSPRAFLLYASCLRQKWNEAPGARLFAPAFPRSTYKLFYELVVSQSAAHSFIISVTWTRSRVAFIAIRSTPSDARRHATPLLYVSKSPRRQILLHVSRVSTLKTMETTEDYQPIGRQLDMTVLVATKTACIIGEKDSRESCRFDR